MTHTHIVCAHTIRTQGRYLRTSPTPTRERGSRSYRSPGLKSQHRESIPYPSTKGSAHISCPPIAVASKRHGGKPQEIVCALSLISPKAPLQHHTLKFHYCYYLAFSGIPHSQVPMNPKGNCQCSKEQRYTVCF